MRYGALAFSSAMLQAVGLIIGLGSPTIGCGVAIYAQRHYNAHTASLVIAAAIGGALPGHLVGLGYAALGQLDAVTIDSEFNTRQTLRRGAWDE